MLKSGTLLLVAVRDNFAKLDGIARLLVDLVSKGRLGGNTTCERVSPLWRREEM